MRNILSKVVILLLLVSVVTPLVPAGFESQQLSTEQMQNITGGQPALNCEYLASASAGICELSGGGWLACIIVGAGTYLACLAANAIVAG